MEGDSEDLFPLVKTHSFDVDGCKYQSSAIFYSDTLQIFVTFDGKIGTLIQSSYKFGTYDSRVLLGNRSSEYTALSRCLTEKYREYIGDKGVVDTELYLLLCKNTEESNVLILKELSKLFTK